MLDKNPKNRPTTTEILKLGFIKDELNNLVIKHSDYSHLDHLTKDLLDRSPLISRNKNSKSKRKPKSRKSFLEYKKAKRETSVNRVPSK